MIHYLDHSVPDFVYYIGVDSARVEMCNFQLRFLMENNPEKLIVEEGDPLSFIEEEGIGARLKINGKGWAVVPCLFADDTVFYAENEEELQRVVDNSVVYVCSTRRKLRVNTGKSLKMKKRWFSWMQLIGLVCQLCKHREMEEEIRERAVEVKRGLRNSILLPTLTRTWTWNRAQQSRILVWKFVNWEKHLAWQDGKVRAMKASMRGVTWDLVQIEWSVV